MFETPNCVLKYLCILLDIFYGVGVFVEKLTVSLSVKEFPAFKYPEDSALCSQGLSGTRRISSHRVILFPLRSIKINYSIILVYRSENCTKYTLWQNISEQVTERTCNITPWHVYVRNIAATLP